MPQKWPIVLYFGYQEQQLVFVVPNICLMSLYKPNKSHPCITLSSLDADGKKRIKRKLVLVTKHYSHKEQ